VKSDKLKDEFDDFKANKATADSSEGGEFGGRGENGAFNRDEGLTVQDNNGIDTDNAMAESNVNIKSDVNFTDKLKSGKNDYLIANGVNLEYKYNKEKPFDIILLKPKLNRAYFWSGTSNGIGDLDYAADVAKKNNGITLEMIVEDNKVSLPKWDFNNPKTVEAWANASAFYAKQASGEIRALIGTKLRENNFWENIELPRLMDNPDVTKIILIDPETLIETIIYEVKNENNRN